MGPQVVAIRKRTQIASANRTMFLWVAAVSVVFGFSLVAVMFLSQMLIFNERVISEKSKTISNLKANNISIVELKKQVKALETNEVLNGVKAYSDDNALQVILDALPSDANSTALGSSLQKRLIEVIPAVSIESIIVDPVVGIESFDGNSSVVDASADSSDAKSEITFKVVVSGTEADLKQMLVNFEKSIRTIDVTSVSVEKQSSSDSEDSGILSMTVYGRAFYEPEVVVELKDKTVK